MNSDRGSGLNWCGRKGVTSEICPGASDERSMQAASQGTGTVAALFAGSVGNGFVFSARRDRSLLRGARLMFRGGEKPLSIWLGSGTRQNVSTRRPGDLVMPFWQAEVRQVRCIRFG